jgi:serine/threonine-protein kinase
MDDDVTTLAATLVGRYRIERELGRGGMSAVYLARDLRHDRSVALKLLRAELAEQIGPERFQREIRLAARLQHPHILTVLDSGVAPSRRASPWRGASTNPGIYWFTMPYVEGESLRDRLDREKQLPVSDALRIAREVALGLEYAHRHGVVHRDIKPENILVSEDGSTLLADFGIACSVEPDTHELRITDSGFALGTPVYMSPEQAAGERDVDARTDIYGLGVVLYELLAGKPPFTGPTPQSVIAQRFSEDVPRLRRARGSVPEEVERMVARAMAVVPADRWSDAASFARALSQAELALASAGTKPQTPTPWLRPVYVALLLALLGAAAIGAYLLRDGDHGETSMPSAANVRRLAVLPFDNLGDTSDAYFAEGVTDAVRGELTAIPGLQVVASGSSRQYRGTRKSPREIGRELNVDYLLVGSVRWEKLPGGTSRVRVTPELVQVSSGSAKWDQSFDAALTDVFQVQSEIAARVAQRLNVALED